MFSQLPYKTLDLYSLSKKLVISCYELSHELPTEEKTNLSRYLRSAALTVHVNTAQGAFLKSKKKRKKFITAAQNSLVIIDAVIEVLIDVKFISEDQSDEVIRLSSQCYQLLDDLLNK
jgi:four helix bundle protein